MRAPPARLDGGYGPLLPLERWPGAPALKAALPDIRALLDRSEFIGVSNYARCGSLRCCCMRPALACCMQCCRMHALMHATPCNAPSAWLPGCVAAHVPHAARSAPADVAASHMEGPAVKMLAELGALGIDLAPRLASGQLRLLWNEFGLGGGVGACGDKPGTNASVGQFPWLGLVGVYNASLDPFKASPVARAYLRKYYAAALQLLAAGRGPRYKLDGAYLWSVGSWDVQGIHTASAEWNTSVEQGDWPVTHGYGDAEVIRAIRAHNARVNGGR